jgi:ABC-type Fe3+-hydroxamate transport system substrate-binding protein
LSRHGRPRVVSLVPSVTETLLAWNVEPVACTRFCEQPSLRHVGGTKDPDLAAIVALAPDLVVVDREENRREDAESLVAAGVSVHVTHVVSVDDVDPMLEALAGAVGHRRAGPPPPADAIVPMSRRRAFIPIWRRPWMTLNAATYGASLLASIGIDNVYDGDAQRYPAVTLDDVALRSPDLVILPSEPYPFTERHVIDVASLAADVRLVDGRDLFWWGERTRDARVRLAQALA